MLAALGAARTETEAALSRQREFVADASHELRTPLTSVLANLELLEAAGMLEAEQQFRRIIGYRDLAKLVIAVGASPHAGDRRRSRGPRNRGAGGRRYRRLR